jgi:hypothetical protein
MQIAFGDREPIVSHRFRGVLGCLPVLLLLGGCGVEGPECDSPGARDSVVKIMSDDRNNALGDYAARNSSVIAAIVGNAGTEAEKVAVLEKARQGAAYRLDDAISTNSRSNAERAVNCSGVVHATVEDVTVQKQVDFKVQETADGKVSISVSPFQF